MERGGEGGGHSLGVADTLAPHPGVGVRKLGLALGAAEKEAETTAGGGREQVHSGGVEAETAASRICTARVESRLAEAIPLRSRRASASDQGMRSRSSFRV